MNAMQTVSQSVGGQAVDMVNGQLVDGMVNGTVKWFNNAKGWGFIRQESGPDVFVHYSQISGDGFRTLREGEVVKFELRDGPKGPLAEKVVRVD
jgi:CspA family cold shock protein